MQAGGLTNAAYPQRIEIAKLIGPGDTLTKEDERASAIIEMNNGNDTTLMQNNVLLSPFDVVTVRKKAGYLPLQSVTITGQMQYPGPYVLSQREERVSDMIKRAGGFTPEAYLEGAYIKRYNEDTQKQHLQEEKIKKIASTLNNDTSQIKQDIEKDFDEIPLDIEKIMEKILARLKMW